MMRSVLGSRASIGGVLGSGRGSAAADWWLSGGVLAANAIAVYQPIGAASLAASYTNLANPGTYTAAPGTAPTFAAATGWTFNGSTQYLTTGVVTSSADWSLIIRFSEKSSTNQRALLGAVKTVPSIIRGIQISMDAAVSNTIFYANGGTAYVETAPRLSSGVLCVAGKSAYRNGTFDATIEAGANVPPLALYIGAANVNTLAVLHCNMQVQAIAIYNTTLSAAQVAAISSAMSALTG